MTRIRSRYLRELRGQKGNSTLIKGDTRMSEPQQTNSVSQYTHYVSQRVRGIGYDQNQRIGREVVDLRADVLKDCSIRREQAEPSDGIAAIGFASTFLVDS